MFRAWLLPLALLALPQAVASAAPANVPVCVKVTLQDASAPAAAAAPTAPAPAGATADSEDESLSSGNFAGLTDEQRQQAVARLRAQLAARQRLQAPTPSAAVPYPTAIVEGLLPVGQDPVRYLQRLLEHFVSHERGFEAVSQGCRERLTVELYPLREGWTAFARYAAHEERVDQIFPDELSQFAERAVLALLYEQPISATIKRDTVLRADSRRSVQRIRGSNHFVLSLGTQLRGGYVPTVQTDGTNKGLTQDQVRVFAPMSLALGYRGKFEGWGVDTGFELAIGTSKTGVAQNPGGGHIDYGGSAGLSLHFLRFLHPRGLSSWYLGGGGTFNLLWFYQVQPEAQRSKGDRGTPLSGGLDVDLLAGYEFLRANSVQFWAQGGLHLPAYAVENSDLSGSVMQTWMPGLSLKIGVMF